MGSSIHIYIVCEPVSQGSYIAAYLHPHTLYSHTHVRRNKVLCSLCMVDEEHRDYWSTAASPTACLQYSS